MFEDHDFDEMYRSGQAAWEIDGPQPALARVLDDQINGPKILDLGCGTGELAIALPRRGYQVTGVDISRVAIETARAAAQPRPAGRQRDAGLPGAAARPDGARRDRLRPRRTPGARPHVGPDRGAAAGTRIEREDLAATVEGRPFTLAGHLLRTTRAPREQRAAP
jgi:SAM-dependent methyltransferase